MKILVTGGTGFLGRRLIPKLVEDGHQVLATTRSASSHEALRALGASPVAGDLQSREPPPLPAIDAVVHAAALFRFAGPRAPYFRTNVDGTDLLLRAAEKAGARTFVHISAAGVAMDDRGSPLRDIDETSPTHPDSFSAYLASKSRGEKLVLAADKPNFQTIAMRPSAIWGAGDGFSRELPYAISSGRFAFFDRGDYAFSTCHVDNVVEAVQCALQGSAGGRPYFINDREQQTFRDFIAMLAGVQGLSIDRVRSIPYSLAFALGGVLEAAWTVTFRKDDPPLSRSMVRMIGREFSTNDGAARNELGYVGRTSRADGLRSYGKASRTKPDEPLRQ